jgi:hypothetical protein
MSGDTRASRQMGEKHVVCAHVRTCTYMCLHTLDWNHGDKSLRRNYGSGGLVIQVRYGVAWRQGSILPQYAGPVLLSYCWHAGKLSLDNRCSRLNILTF